MSKRANCGPAFPVVRPIDDPLGLCAQGASLRDYFAAKAMAAYIASSKPVDIHGTKYVDDDGSDLGIGPELWMDETAIVAAAYWMADAMINRRDK